MTKTKSAPRYVTKEFPKETLQTLVYDDAEDGFEHIQTQLVDTSRWSTIHRLTFRAPDGNIYQVPYTEGATEYQDEIPFEYEDDMISCVQVRQVQRVVDDYEPVKIGE